MQRPIVELMPYEGRKDQVMKQNDYWHEDELYDMDNVYNMERDENYAAADTSVWYT